MCEFFTASVENGRSRGGWSAQSAALALKLRQRNDINVPKKQKNVFTTFISCANIYVGGGWTSLF